jgi:hypothetical protein
MKEAFIDRNFQKSTLVVIEQAVAIIDEYAAQGFTLTLRQLDNHYRALSARRMAG